MAFLILGLAARWLAGTVPSQESSPAGFDIWQGRVEAVDTLCRIEKRLTFSYTAGPLFYGADWPCFSHSALSPSLGYSQAPFSQLPLGVTGIGRRVKTLFETRSLAVKDAVKHAVIGHAFVESVQAVVVHFGVDMHVVYVCAIISLNPWHDPISPWL